MTFRAAWARSMAWRSCPRAASRSAQDAARRSRTAAFRHPVEQNLAPAGRRDRRSGRRRGDQGLGCRGLGLLHGPGPRLVGLGEGQHGRERATTCTPRMLGAGPAENSGPATGRRSAGAHWVSPSLVQAARRQPEPGLHLDGVADESKSLGRRGAVVVAQEAALQLHRHARATSAGLQAGGRSASDEAGGRPLNARGCVDEAMTAPSGSAVGLGRPGGRHLLTGSGARSGAAP
jgi:hypothetical protein